MLDISGPGYVVGIIYDFHLCYYLGGTPTRRCTDTVLTLTSFRSIPQSYTTIVERLNSSVPRTSAAERNISSTRMLYRWYRKRKRQTRDQLGLERQSSVRLRSYFNSRSWHIKRKQGITSHFDLAVVILPSGQRRRNLPRRFETEIAYRRRRLPSWYRHGAPSHHG